MECSPGGRSEISWIGSSSAGGLVWQFETRFHWKDRQKIRREKNPQHARDAA
jgi:hypothetical protein